jgi:hypothetical protein
VKTTLTSCRIFAAGSDLTSPSDKISVKAELEKKKTTNFGSGGWVELISGTGSAELSASGQWEAGDASRVDDAMWSAAGGIGPWTVCPTSANVADLAYLTKALNASYEIGDSVGEVAPWSASASGSWPLVRGQILHPPGVARTATGTGSAVQLGAVAATKRLYLCLHVLSVAGTGSPALTVLVESDDNSGFASASTVATFTAATAISGQAQLLEGPVADTYLRVRWTIAGTSPSFLFLVSAGIA